MGLSWGYHDPSVDEAAAMDLVRYAIDHGVDHLDTADVYGPFTNESLVGRAISGRRDRVTLATKGGYVVDDSEAYKYHRDGRPEHIRAACDASLRRLGVDVIDLYYLHRIDPQVPLESTWDAMAGLVAAGKVRWLGISEATIADLDRVSRIHRVTAVQSELSLWTRDYLPEVVPWCRAHGASFVAFSPLGRGFLTGAIGAEARFGPGDFRSRLPRFRPEAVAENQKLVERVRAVAVRARRDRRAGGARVGARAGRPRARDPRNPAAQVPRSERRGGGARADRRGSRRARRAPGARRRTVLRRTVSDWPALPLEDWKDTYATLHM